MSDACKPICGTRTAGLGSGQTFLGGLSASPIRNTVFVLIALLNSIPAEAQSLQSYAKDFYEATVSPETIFMPAPFAAFSNYVSKPAGFGSGAEGLGYHYGVSLADNVNGKLMRKFIFAAASRQPEQYIPLGSGNSLWKRMVHAATHSLFASPEPSTRAFNWSGFPASLAAAGLSNAYQPVQQRTWSATFVRFATNSGSYAAGDRWLEFTAKPRQNRLFRAFFKSH